MKAFNVFLLLIVGSLLAAAVVAYPLWILLNTFSEQPIHRVFIRAAMICGIVGFACVVHVLRLESSVTRGFGSNVPSFLGELLKGIPTGYALLFPLVALLFILPARDLAGHDLSAARLVGFAGIGLAFGLIVAFVEETFCRGALQGSIAREAGALPGVIGQSVLYASLHFIGGDLRIPQSEVTWGSGFLLLQDVISPFFHFMDYADAYIALVAVGVLLGIVRQRRGTIAMGVGMHAAWISTIYLVHRVSSYDATSSWAWVASQNYDGVIGWAALGVMLPMIFVAARWWPEKELTETRHESQWLTGKIVVAGTVMIAGILAKDITQGAPITRGEAAAQAASKPN